MMTASRTDARIDLLALSREGPVHFVGVAGAGVSALAELVLRRGGRVTGCDLKPGSAGESLRALGAEIVQGHDPSHVQGASAVVTTAALPQDHPELMEARRRGVPVLKRAAALGAMVNRGTVVAIAGTHGKTSTTAMTAAVLERGDLDPTAFVGGRVPGWTGGLRVGESDVYVVEADEYDRSFLSLRPDVAVVTTLEQDHMEIYGSLDGLVDGFVEFLEPVPDDGLIALCVDDAGVADLGRRLARPVLRYGTTKAAELRAVEIESRGRGSRFLVEWRGEILGEVGVSAPGLHNVRNALAAVAAGRHLGVELEEAAAALSSYRGVSRRFEELGEVAGVVVVDDYAHHPTEVSATLAAARNRYSGRRLVAVFQPHLYSRTRDFHREFGEALCAADVVWVTDVFPAREDPIEGVTGELVAEAARFSGADEVVYHEGLEELDRSLADALRSGDVCLCMGAGDITDVARSLVRTLGARGES